MKKHSILLAASYKSYREIYSTILGYTFKVVTRESLPEPDDLILKRVRLILVINVWNPLPGLVLYRFAETVQLPVIVLHNAVHEFAGDNVQNSRYLHSNTFPISNEKLIDILYLILSDSAPDQTSNLEIREHMEQDKYHASAKSSTFQRKIKKLLEYINTNYASIDSFTKLAKGFDLNYKSMYKAIKQKTGYSPQEYLREIKFEKTLQFIQFTDLKPDEIFTETGYKYKQYAKKQFRMKFGIDIEECIAKFRK